MENIHEILYIFLNVIGICANLVVLYLIIDLNRNVKTVPNILFANCMVSQIVFLLCSIMFYVLLIIIASSSNTGSFKWIHIAEEAELTFFIVTLLSNLLVVIDWTLAACIHRTSELFRKFYFVAIVVVWGLSLIHCFARVIIIHVLHLDWKINNFFFQFLFYVIFVVTAVIQIYRIIQLCHHKKFQNSVLMLNLASVWLVMQLPMIIFATILHVDIMYYENFETFETFGICTRYIMNVQPIVNIVLLVAFYRQFKENSNNSFNERLEGFARYGMANNQTEQHPLNEPNN